MEVHYFSQGRTPEFEARAEEESDSLVIGLNMERDELYRRIDQRVDDMMARAFLSEVEALAARGLSFDLGALSSPGYRELWQFLAGALTLEEAVQRTKFQTHRLARRQHAWFKPNDPRITWLDAANPTLPEQAATLVDAFLERREG